MPRLRLSSCSARQRIRANVAFFYSQPVVSQKIANPLGIDAQGLSSKSPDERHDVQGGMFDFLHQNGDGLGRRGASTRFDPTRTLSLLLCTKARLGSQVHIEALMLFALQGRVVPQRPEERTGP